MTRMSHHGQTKWGELAQPTVCTLHPNHRQTGSDPILVQFRVRSEWATILPELSNSDPHRACKIDSGCSVDQAGRDYSQEIPDSRLSCQRSLFPCVDLRNTSLVLEP